MTDTYMCVYIRTCEREREKRGGLRKIKMNIWMYFVMFVCVFCTSTTTVYMCFVHRQQLYIFQTDGMNKCTIPCCPSFDKSPGFFGKTVLPFLWELVLLCRLSPLYFYPIFIIFLRFRTHLTCFDRYICFFKTFFIKKNIYYLFLFIEKLKRI